MKKMLFAAMAALSMIACNKDDNATITPGNGTGAMVNLIFSDAPTSRAFFDNTIQAEAWEKTLTSLAVYVFDNAGSSVTQRAFTADELTAKSATFALPHAAAGTTCDFCAVANLSLTGITNKAALLAKLETAAADYNGTFVEVSTKAKRNGGFVMAAMLSRAIAAEGAATNVALTLKRTVSKIAVQTAIDPAFGNKYSGKLTLTNVQIKHAASQTPVIAPAAPKTAAMIFAHTQAPATVSEKYNSLFYIFENGALTEDNRVMVEITATYDADGNDATTADRSEIVYNIPLIGSAGGTIERNGYYRVAANIKGLAGSEVGLTVTVADWEVPATQEVNLGA